MIISFVLPHLKALGDRVQSALEGLVVNNADKIAADNIRKIVCVSFIFQLFRGNLLEAVSENCNMSLFLS